MNKRYAAVWPEGNPNKAAWAQSWLHMHWLMFWLGIKTFWPNPLNAKRICAYIQKYPFPFNTPAFRIAEMCEDWFKRS
jgi:hypothetical protein